MKHKIYIGFNKYKIYVGIKKYVSFFGKKLIEKTLEFLSLPAKFVSKKVQELKNLTMWGKSVQDELPDGYTRLAYLESTGTQYIDTGVNLTLNTKHTIDFKIALTDTTNGNNQSTGANHNLNLVVSSTSMLKFRPCGIALSDFDENWHTIQLSKDIDNTRHYKIDELSGDATEATEDGMFYLFSCYGTTSPRFARYKMSYCKIYTNDILVRNLIPAKRNSDGVLGMYDTVTGEFLINAGTGEFIAGLEIIPSPTNPIEIESVGDRTKNLFNLNVESYNGYIKPQNVGNIIYFVSSKLSKSYLKIAYLKRGTYCYSLDNSPIAGNARVCICDDDRIIRYTMPIPIKEGYNESTFTTNVDGWLYVTTIVGSDSIQIEEGDTATSYEPYGYKIPVTIGIKNLIDQDDFFSAVTDWNKVDGIWHGRIKSVADKYNSYDNCYPINVDVASFSIKARTETSTRIYVKFFYTDGTNTSVNLNTSSDEFTSIFLASDPNKKIKGVALSYGTGSYADIMDMIIVEGTYTEETMPSYTPTTTNIYLSEPLRKIGDYADTLSVDGTDVTVLRNVKSEKLGTTDWVYQSKYTRFVKSFMSFKSLGTRNTPFLSSCFIKCDDGRPVTSVLNNSVYSGSEDYNIYFKTDVYNTVESFTEALKDVDIVYPLATPTTETYTIENSIQLKRGTLTIDTSTNIKPSKIEITGAIDNE